MAQKIYFCIPIEEKNELLIFQDSAKLLDYVRRTHHVPYTQVELSEEDIEKIWEKGESTLPIIISLERYRERLIEKRVKRF